MTSPPRHARDSRTSHSSHRAKQSALVSAASVSKSRPKSAYTADCDATMSDTALLPTIETIINSAFSIGPEKGCIIHFKAIRSVLLILADNMRVLQRPVQVQKTAGGQGLELLQEAKLLSTTAMVGKTNEGKSTKSYHNLNIELSEEEKGKGADASEKDRGHRGRLSSTEVVTQSQFQRLELAVRALQDKVAPRAPTLPKDKKLLEELVKGRATLADVMQVLQIGTRMQAAETAIARLAELLTELAAAGVLPSDLALKARGIRAQVEALLAAAAEGLAKESHAPPEQSVSKPATDSSAAKGKTSQKLETSPSVHTMKVASKQSASSSPRRVTLEEMEQALALLRTELAKEIKNRSAQCTTTANSALHTARAVEGKMSMAMLLDQRITALQAAVSDYTQQLSGLDASTHTQVEQFKLEIHQMRDEMSIAFGNEDDTRPSGPAAHIVELTERHGLLVRNLEQLLEDHAKMITFQQTMRSDVKDLAEAVEVLREQKADHDELADGLRDKADLRQLTNMVTEELFEVMRLQLQSRLNLCHEKLRRTNHVWMEALKDICQVVDQKTDDENLHSLKAEMQDQLRDMSRKVRILVQVLGDPKAAAITRKLSKDAKCVVCKEPARIDAAEPAGGAPVKLPAIGHNPPVVGAQGDVCLRDLVERDPKEKTHVCHRWAGGSHTLMRLAPTKETRSAPARAGAIQRYIGLGTDGKSYRLQKQMLPCQECSTQPAQGPEEKEIEELISNHSHSIYNSTVEVPEGSLKRFSLEVS